MITICTNEVEQSNQSSGYPKERVAFERQILVDLDIFLKTMKIPVQVISGTGTDPTRKPVPTETAESSEDIDKQINALLDERNKLKNEKENIV